MRRIEEWQGRRYEISSNPCPNCGKIMAGYVAKEYLVLTTKVSGKCIFCESEFLIDVSADTIVKATKKEFKKYQPRLESIQGGVVDKL